MLKGENLKVIIELALIESREGNIIISTNELSRILNCSQQTASRRLQELEKDHLITRQINSDGQLIRLTKDSTDTIRKQFMKLKSIFEPIDQKPIQISGYVTSGLGEGAYYMSIEEYWVQIEEKIGFEPYHGTLNIRLNIEEYDIFHELRNHHPIIIKGFKKEQRSFGSLTCYPAQILDVKGALIFAERTSHGSNIIEFIAPINLRTEYKLRDGDRIKIKIK
ncbi:MAG: DUF120 domain-containing protein [Candidatus Ranarchaeia archaeon]